MTLRKIVFWMHLIAGVTAGLVILIMSVTGVMLAYEKQILAWSNSEFIGVPAPSGEERLPLETLIANAMAANAGVAPSSLTFYARSRAVGAATDGATIFVDGYSGRVMGSGNVVNWFRSVRSWHRYFGMSGASRSTGAIINGTATIVGAFLAVIGIYLWFPNGPMWFRRGLRGKARNWNWHNVLGFWAAIPLFFVLVAGVVISFDWATNLVYTVTGTVQSGDGPTIEAPVVNLATLNPLLHQAMRQTADWNTVVLKLPIHNKAQVSFTIDAGTGGQPYLKSTLVMNADTGAIVKWDRPQDLNLGRRARNWFRFVHTGEYYGLTGQTVAGLAALSAVMLVWTGLMLALRRASLWLKVRFARRGLKVAPTLATNDIDAA